MALRWSVTARAKLEREMALVDSGGQSVAVKLVKRPNGQTSAKTDVEYIKGSGGHGERRQRRRTAEQDALLEHAPDDPCRDK